MFDEKGHEVPSGERRKILLVGLRPRDQSLISTFLISMGCTSAMVPREEASAILEREGFDAVLLKLGPSDAAADKLILRLKQIRPTLAGRIVVITNRLADRETIELIEHHHLLHVSRERLFAQLWATLEELFSQRSWQLPVRDMGVPRMIFDSLRCPPPAGARSLFPGVRQLAYQYKSTVIDLCIEFPEETRRTSVTGQLLDREKRINYGLSVLLVCGAETLARTATNEFGEFHVECESNDTVSLEIQLSERSWVNVPLGKIGQRHRY